MTEVTFFQAVLIVLIVALCWLVFRVIWIKKPQSKHKHSQKKGWGRSYGY